MTYFLTLKMEAVQSFETSLNFYQTTRHHITERTVLTLLDAKRQPYFSFYYVPNLTSVIASYTADLTPTSLSFLRNMKVKLMEQLRNADKDKALNTRF
jgi:hypothetical protein